jgi:hypothetical protein
MVVCFFFKANLTSATSLAHTRLVGRIALHFTNQGGHEIYAAVFCSVHEVVITLVILFWGIYTDATMHELGLIFVISESSFFLLNVAVIAKMGWWRKYYPGMIRTFALKVSKA